MRDVSYSAAVEEIEEGEVVSFPNDEESDDRYFVEKADDSWKDHTGLIVLHLRPLDDESFLLKAGFKPEEEALFHPNETKRQQRRRDRR